MSNKSASKPPFFTSSKNIRLLFGVSCVSFFLGASMLHHQRQGHRVKMATHSQWISPPLSSSSSSTLSTLSSNHHTNNNNNNNNNNHSSCTASSYKACGLVVPQNHSTRVTITPNKTVSNDGEGDVLLYTCKIQAMDVMSGHWKTMMRFAIKKSDLALQLANAQVVNEQLKLAEEKLIAQRATTAASSSSHTATSTTSSTSSVVSLLSTNHGVNENATTTTTATRQQQHQIQQLQLLQQQQQMKDELLHIWQKLVEDNVKQNNDNNNNKNDTTMELLIHSKDHPTKMGTLIHTNQATRLAKFNENLTIPTNKKEFLEYLKRSNIVRFEPGVSESEALKVLKFVHKGQSHIKAGKEVRIYESVIREGDAITVYGTPRWVESTDGDDGDNSDASSKEQRVCFETHMLSEEDDEHFTKHLQKKQNSGYNLYKAYIAGMLYMMYELFV